MKVPRKILKHKKAIILLVLIPVVIFVGLNVWMILAAQERIYSDLMDLPENEVGLLLGTSKYTSGGNINLHFRNRIEAAARLYHEGKIKRLLASGHTDQARYNEPETMKDELIKKGIPPSAITLDLGGHRTIDSVVRAREVFGLQGFTIISQKYHNYRAVFLGKHYGLDVVAYCADDVEFVHSVKTEIREFFARIKAVIDVYVLRKKPAAE